MLIRANMKRIILSLLLTLLLAGQSSATGWIGFSFIAYEDDTATKSRGELLVFSYRKYPIEVRGLGIDEKNKTIEIFFYDSSDKNVNTKPINMGQESTIPTLTSEDKMFEADPFQKIQLKKGQIVRLKGTNLKFEFVDFIELHCPPEVKCEAGIKKLT